MKSFSVIFEPVLTKNIDKKILAFLHNNDCVILRARLIDGIVQGDIDVSLDAHKFLNFCQNLQVEFTDLNFKFVKKNCFIYNVYVFSKSYSFYFLKLDVHFKEFWKNIDLFSHKVLLQNKSIKDSFLNVRYSTSLKFYFHFLNNNFDYICKNKLNEGGLLSKIFYYLYKENQMYLILLLKFVFLFIKMFFSLLNFSFFKNTLCYLKSLNVFYPVVFIDNEDIKNIDCVKYLYRGLPLKISSHKSRNHVSLICNTNHNMKKNDSLFQRIKSELV